MNIKHFQDLAQIRNQYDSAVRSTELGMKRLGVDAIGIYVDSYCEHLRNIEYRDAVSYLVDCKHGFTHGPAQNQPDINIIIDALAHYRHIAETVLGYNPKADNTSDYMKHIGKQYDACTHWEFQLTLPGVVKFLPAEIPSA